MQFPSLGDETKTYPVELTEPEINAIHAAYGFMNGCGFVSPNAPRTLKDWWEHYGATLEHLSKRLGVFDDRPKDVYLKDALKGLVDRL